MALPLRVLVIEDDQDIRAVLKEALASEGYFVDEAAHGLEGLRRARDQRPDLILLDLMMPIMDGWSFRKEQQGDPFLARIPVLIISAWQGQRSPILADVPMLHKPFGIDDLLQAVRHSAIAA